MKIIITIAIAAFVLFIAFMAIGMILNISKDVDDPHKGKYSKEG